MKTHITRSILACALLITPLAACDSDSPPVEAAVDGGSAAPPADTGVQDAQLPSGDAQPDVSSDDVSSQDVGSQDADAGPPPAPPCPAAVVPAGFGTRWVKANHRVSLWGYAAADDGCLAEHEGAPAVRASIIGGNFTTGGEGITQAEAEVELHHRVVDGGADAEVGFARRATTLALVGPETEATVTEQVSLAEAGLSGYDTVTVVLAGIEVTTDVPQGDGYTGDYDPAHGFTSRGLGARIAEIAVDGDTLSYAVWARFQHGPADRPDMNEAIPQVTTQAVVHALMVGAHEGVVTTGEVSYRETYDKAPQLQDVPLPPIPEEVSALTIEGSPGMGGFPALTSFDFRLNPEGEDGYYIRELSVGVEGSVDPDTGVAELHVPGFASNAGIISYEAMDNEFSAEVAVIQWPEAGALPAQVTTWTLGAGVHELSLADEEGDE